jgi:quercetin dioxygenase-like cupin family protein
MRLLNIIAFGLLLVCSASNAQQPPNISLIMEVPITGQPDKVFVLYSIDWPPDSIMSLHSHPGDEFGTVIKGAYAVRQIDGQWKTYITGEGFRVPAGVVHEEKNMSFATTTMHACVCEKDKKVLQLYTKP